VKEQKIIAEILAVGILRG